MNVSEEIIKLYKKQKNQIKIHSSGYTSIVTVFILQRKKDISFCKFVNNKKNVILTSLKGQQNFEYTKKKLWDTFFS